VETGADGEPRSVALVHFVCDRPGAPSRSERTLTIYERKWSYCGGMHPGDHHWVPTGGVSIVQLIRSGARTTARA
jgi:hypothetical protein